MAYKVISFHDFMVGTSYYSAPPHLPLMEGIVGFGALGAVLIILAIAEKKGWLHVDEGLIKFGMMCGFIYGVIRLIFASMKLMFI